MKILVWNVNCAVGGKHGRLDLKSLLTEIPTYDIVVLTEFYRLSDYGNFEKQIRDWGFEPFITPQQDKRNDVFIAILKEHNPSLIVQNNQVKSEGMPEFLAVSSRSDDKELVIVGVRFFGDYNNMKNQFIEFLPLINGFEYAIIGGDFNNGKIYGGKNIIYTEQQIDRIYLDTANGIAAKYEHFEYNYHRIKLWLDQNKFSLITPDEGFSCPYKAPYTGGSKIDHFATRGIQISKVEYLATKLSDHYKLVGKI